MAKTIKNSKADSRILQISHANAFLNSVSCSEVQMGKYLLFYKTLGVKTTLQQISMSKKLKSLQLY